MKKPEKGVSYLLYILPGLLLLFILSAKKECAGPSLPQKPGKTRILAFYEEGWGGIYTGSLERLQQVKERVDIVSPVWLGLTAQGRVAWDKTNTRGLSFFTQQKLEFLVLVTAGTGRNAGAILANEANRRSAIDSIAGYVKKIEAPGVCIDFEYVNPALKGELTGFIKELKERLAKKKLFIAVFPHVDWPEPSKEVYDYMRLGEICDGVVVMTYDEHRPGDAPGPVASRKWVEDNLAYFLARIEPHKLWLGIAGYGYRWRSGAKKATALPAWYCRKTALQRGATDTYQSDEGNDMLQFTEKGIVTTIWWEGARGMKEKLAMAQKHKLAGVAIWRLGYEENEFWK